MSRLRSSDREPKIAGIMSIAEADFQHSLPEKTKFGARSRSIAHRRVSPKLALQNVSFGKTDLRFVRACKYRLSNWGHRGARAQLESLAILLDIPLRAYLRVHEAMQQVDRSAHNA